MSGGASPLRERKGHWVAAITASVAVHVAGMAVALDLVPDWIDAPPKSFPDTFITISDVSVDVPPAVAPPDTLSGGDPASETLAPEAPDELAETGAPESSLTSEGPQDVLRADTGTDALGPEAEDPEPAAEADIRTPPAEGEAVVEPAEQPEIAAAAQAAPADLPSIAPITGGGGALAPVTVAPLSAVPAESGTLTGASPGTNAATVAALPQVTAPQIAPVTPPASGGTLRSAIDIAPTGGARRPVRPAGPPPDPAVVELVRRIRGRLDESCLIALPRGRPAPLGPLLVTVTADDTTAAAFADAILDETLPGAEAQTILVDRRQCPAVTFLRAREAYPVFRLRLTVADSQVTSGETVVGRIDGAAGAYTTLLLVDDNGVVQDLRRFLRFSGGQAEFAVPVTRDGDPRETGQLLLAIATASRPDTIARLAGRLAADVFPALADELDASARLAVVPLDIR